MFHADLQGLPRALARVEAGCARLGADAKLDRKLREPSGGHRRKVALVRAALHAPGLLLMDEGMVALDPKSRLDVVTPMGCERGHPGACGGMKRRAGPAERKARLLLCRLLGGAVAPPASMA